MGIFWDYFRKTLRWPLIWGPGPLGQIAEGGAGALDAARDDCLWLRDQFVPEKCDADFLADFAKSRGLRRWPSETDSFWRARVGGAFKFFRVGGTLAGLADYLAMAGLEADIIEPSQSRQAWSDSGGLRLDGGWSLSGGSALVDFFSVTRLPYIDWAEFVVVLNLGSTFDLGWDELLRYIISETKPARSVAVMLYRLGLVVDALAWAGGSLYLKKNVVIDYPRCTPTLDGSWDLGFDGGVWDLADGKILDGSWDVGGGWDAVSGVLLEQCNILVRAVLTKHCQVQSDIRARLGEGLLRVNGGWSLGENRLFALSGARIAKRVELPRSGGISLEHKIAHEIGYPAQPARLSLLPKLTGVLRLNGLWPLKPLAGRVLDGAWQLVTIGIKAELTRKYGKAFEVSRSVLLGAAWRRLGDWWSRRLDGSWQVGGDKDLDGSWVLGPGSYLTVPALGRVYAKLNGSWLLGYSRKLSGGWTLGGEPIASIE